MAKWWYFHLLIWTIKNWQKKSCWCEFYLTAETTYLDLTVAFCILSLKTRYFSFLKKDPLFLGYVRFCLSNSSIYPLLLDENTCLTQCQHLSITLLVCFVCFEEALMIKCITFHECIFKLRSYRHRNHVIPNQGFHSNSNMPFLHIFSDGSDKINLSLFSPHSLWKLKLSTDLSFKISNHLFFLTLHFKGHVRYQQ